MGVLIVGLGNPGDRYEKTRHNAGFIVLNKMAQREGLQFKFEKSLKADIAKGVLFGKKCLLVKPMTYMNLSGEALLKCLAYYKDDTWQVLVVSDDADIPFGEIRLRLKGSAGGHNGLKSIEQCLGTNEYPRLKVGVGRDERMPLDAHVLAPFNSEEQGALEGVVKSALNELDTWIQSIEESKE